MTRSPKPLSGETSIEAGTAMSSLIAALDKVTRGTLWRVVLGCASVVGFIAVWYLAAWLAESGGTVRGSVVPYPHEVLDALDWLLWNQDRVTRLFLVQHVFASLERVFVGFGLALALALPAGLLMGRQWIAHSVGRPVVEIFRPIPPLAWAPAFLIIMGVFWGPVTVVFLGAFFPILFSVMLGARSVDPTLLDAARTLGAGRVSLFLKVVLPFTIPYLMTGITVGLGISWMCIVAAEFVSGEGGGLGYFILAQSDYGYYPEMFAGMVVIGALSALTTGLAGVLEGVVYDRMGMK